jgi:hypothetical protein
MPRFLVSSSLHVMVRLDRSVRHDDFVSYLQQLLISLFGSLQPASGSPLRLVASAAVAHLNIRELQPTVFSIYGLLIYILITCTYQKHDVRSVGCVPGSQCMFSL